MWWALAGCVWTAVSIAVGIGIGRAVKLRDTQKPTDAGTKQ
jgi:hypothetical protein